MDVITARIPEEDMRLLEQIEKEERTDRAAVVRRLLAKGIAQWRMEKALGLLRQRKASLRRAAKVAGVGYVEMLEAASRAGVETGYERSDLERDRARR